MLDVGSAAGVLANGVAGTVLPEFRLKEMPRVVVALAAIVVFGTTSGCGCTAPPPVVPAG